MVLTTRMTPKTAAMTPVTATSTGDGPVEPKHSPPKDSLPIKPSRQTSGAPQPLASSSSTLSLSQYIRRTVPTTAAAVGPVPNDDVSSQASSTLASNTVNDDDDGEDISIDTFGSLSVVSAVNSPTTSKRTASNKVTSPKSSKKKSSELDESCNSKQKKDKSRIPMHFSPIAPLSPAFLHQQKRRRHPH